MNRLQKKCVIGTAGIHLLLFLILIVGPAFFNRQPKADNTVLDMIPANLVDNALNSGVQNAQPPPPAPVTPPTPQDLRPPPPIRTQPQVVQPPPPQPTPKIVQPDPSFLEQVKRYFEPKPTPAVTPDMTPVNRPEKSHQNNQNNIDVNTTLVKRKPVKNSRHTNPDNSQNTAAINNAIQSLSHHLSSATKIDIPGNATAAYANYATVVRSVYEQMLLTQKPEQVAREDETTKVKIVVTRDGTVVSSSIISRSGDPAWDDAVQRTLDKVTFIAPFPDGATDNERSYNLSFNPEVEQSF